MRGWIACVGVLVLAFVGTPSAAAGQSADAGLELVRELDRRNRGYGDFRARLEMRVSSGGSTPRVRTMRVHGLESERGDHTLIVLERPADLAGTSFLSVTEQDGGRNQWIYLPTVRRARRIGGGRSSDPFLGSHFRYDDMAPPGVEGFTYTWVRGQEIDGRAGALVSRCRGGCADNGERALLWIETDRMLLRRVDYFDEAGRRSRTLELSAYAEIGGFWRPQRMSMADLVEGGSTELLWSDFEIGVGLRERDFDPTRLGRSR